MAIEKILVVDDEEDLCEILQFNLENAGFIVDVAYSAEEVLKQTNLDTYNLFIFDVMMGEISGFKLGTSMRKNDATANIPIIFITARDTETDKLAGFSIGADDYISKPFSINEVIARVRAVLKRSQQNNKANGLIGARHESIDGSQMPDTLGYEQLQLNLSTKVAYINNIEIKLTKKEFELLCLFLHRKDTVLSREQLLENIWKDESFVLDRTIDVNITRLRKKIRPYDKHLITRQGYGYIFSTN